MAETNKQTKQRKDRSPNFPFITLEKALGRAETFYNAERQKAAAVPVAVDYWGYAEKSSGGIQTVAALKSYGLIEDIGKGEKRKIKLTDLALQILMPRPDSMERSSAIKQAALIPKQMRDVFNKWQDQAPSEPSLRWYLIREKNFSEESATDFIKIWNKNKYFSGLYNSSIMDVVKESNPELYASVAETVTQQGITGPRQFQVEAGVSSRAAIIKTEKVIGPEGDIVLQFSGEPSIETYEFLKDYIDLRLKTLTRKREKSEET